jgi:hypothetical protein
MSKIIKLFILCAALSFTVVSVQTFSGSTPSAAADPAAVMQGKIVETMDSGGYTYVCVESDGQKQWAAVPATKATVGDVVTVSPGMVMRNFTSKSLGRTFEAIVFSQGITKQ